MTPPDASSAVGAAETPATDSIRATTAHGMWRPLRSLRRAIAAWFVLVLVLTTTGFGATLCWYFQKSLNDEVDSELQGHAAALTPAVLRLQMEERRREFERREFERRNRDRREDRNEFERDNRGPGDGRGDPRERGEPGRPEGRRPGDDHEPSGPRESGSETADSRPPVAPRTELEPPMRELPLGAIEAEAFRRSRGAPYYVLWSDDRVVARSPGAPLDVPFPSVLVERMESERSDRERLERERLDRERGERIDRERAERERLAALHAIPATTEAPSTDIPPHVAATPPAGVATSESATSPAATPSPVATSAVESTSLEGTAATVPSPSAPATHSPALNASAPVAAPSAIDGGSRDREPPRERGPGNPFPPRSMDGASPVGRGPTSGPNSGSRRGPNSGDQRGPHLPAVGRAFPRGTARELAVVLSPHDVLIVGRSMEAEHTRFASFIGVVALAGLSTVLIAAVGGWLLASLALRPIAAMTDAAADISERNLRNRLDVDTAPTEMRDLASTINGAFDRLEDSFGRLRKFTADASHELRTPLAIASSHVQLALSRERSGDEYRKTLTTCRAALDRMGRLVESMLTLARLDVEPTRPGRGACDLSRLAHEATTLLRPLADEHGSTIVGPHGDAAPVLVSAEADRLLQVILNLAGNAIYYNRPEGRVDVTVTIEDRSAVLRVADQGEGIPLEDQPRIFERFFRADKSRSRRRGGAGLGLSIARRIVELHGGRISFTSRPGEGTTFEVRLPLAVSAPRDAANDAAPPADDAWRNDSTARGMIVQRVAASHASTAETPPAGVPTTTPSAGSPVVERSPRGSSNDG